MIIITAALSLVFGSITGIEAAGIADEWPYVLYDTATGIIMVSEQPLVYGQSPVMSTVGASDTVYVNYGQKPFNYAAFQQFANNYVYGWMYYAEGDTSSGLIEAWLLYPVEVDGTAHYTAYYPMKYYSSYSSSKTNSITYVLSQDFNLTTITGNYTPSGYSGTVGALPDDIGGGQSVEDVLNELLAQTTVGDQAESISAGIDTTVASYEAGTISTADATAQLDTYSTQLNSLSQSAAATITDLIQVNNAQNNLIYAQDKIQQTADTALNSAIQAQKDVIVQTYLDYTNGLTTQEEANTAIAVAIYNIHNLSNTYTDTADLEAINSAISFGHAVQNSVSQYADLDQTTSEEAQTSFAEEVTYLDDMVETVASITELDDGIEDSDVASFNSVATKLWDMEIFKLIIPVAGIMMVISVALGVKYRL